MHGGKWDLVGTVPSRSAIGAQVPVSNLGVDCMRVRRNKTTNLVGTVPSRSAIGAQVPVSNLGEEREKRPVPGLSR
jgi:hypothetical protein